MIIGTAGHIDHGKSALVQALTGRAMDPLGEERRRGITLDLHFVPLELADGRIAGVIDVPGHEDLVRTMIAGAAGLDLVLLVIAADEGIMPLTREHLAILEQLRVARGIPVLTKMDLVEPDWLQLVAGEVTDWLAPSPVRFAAPVATSATRNLGLDRLRATIEETIAGLDRRDPDDLFRLPVDRALSLAGAGTVVTGTAWSGRLRIGDSVRLLPGGAEARVRSLERHGQAVTETDPGDRIAAGLAGLNREAVRRGDVLVRAADGWGATTAIDAEIELLAGTPRPLAHHTRVRVHLGTSEVLGRVRLRGSLAPGTRGMVRLALEAPVLARGGDRIVLRSYSPVATIGGGWVVDPDPPRRQLSWPADLAASDAALRLRALATRRPGGLERSRLPLLLGTGPALVDALIGRSGLRPVDGFLVSPDEAAAAAARALELVQEYHRAHPAAPGVPVETLRAGLTRGGAASAAGLADLLREGRITVEGSTARLPEFRPASAGGEAFESKVLAAVQAAGLTPPTVAELEGQLGARGVLDALRLAERAGRLTAVERDRFYATEPLSRFTAQLERLGRAGMITPAALRDATGLSRKYLIPLLEWADRQGLTRRQGDGRVWTGRG